MFHSNRNKVQKKKKKSLLLPLIIFFIIALIDAVAVLNYSKIMLAEPKLNIGQALEKTYDMLKSVKTAFQFKFSNELINKFWDTQRKLILPYVIILMGLLSTILKPKSDFKGIEYGSADWAKEKDKKRFENSKNTFILAHNMYLDPNDKENDNANELVIGGPGSGKSFRKIKADILQMVGSYVCTDPKGELYRDNYKVLKKNGYKIKVLNLLQPRYSNGYNPFKYINKETLESDVLVLVNVFMKNTSDSKKQGGDQFWDDSMKALLTAIVFYLVLEDDERKNFERVFELVRNVAVDEETGDIDPDKSELERIFKNIDQTNPYHPGLQAYQEFKLASGKTAKSILISLAVRLNIWINPDICTMTYEDEMEFENVGTEKTAIFIITPDTDDTFNVLASMFCTQLFKTLFYEADFHHNGRLPYLVSCELDEFANIGELPNIEKYIATCRSRNVRIVPVVQALSQLEKLYKDTWETIIGCCYVINYLGTTDQKTQKFVSERLGKATVFVETIGQSRGSKSASNSKNGSYVARDLYSVDEINAMPKLDSIVFIKGLRPFYCEKFKTQEHPLIKDVGSSFQDGIPNNADISKVYGEIAKERRAKYLERRNERENSRKLNQELMEKFNNMDISEDVEEEEKESNIAKEFEDQFGETEFIEIDVHSGL